MKRIIIFGILAIVANFAFSNSRGIILAKPYYDKIKISAGIGFTNASSYFDSSYYRLLNEVSGEDRPTAALMLPETDIVFEVARRFGRNFSLGIETGISVASMTYGINGYDMVALPLRLVAVVGHPFYNIGGHVGAQGVISDDPYMGEPMQFPIDVGVRASLFGLELRISYLYTQGGFREGLTSSIFYNVLLQ